MGINYEELDVDDFLGHSGASEGSGRAGFLSGWKDKGRADVWLHPKGKPIPLWSHNWWYIGKDRETGNAVIRYSRFNSLERETVIRKRFFRDSEGNREVPPELCPFSKLLEWVECAIRDESIDWTDEIFRFEVPGDSVVLNAGGFTGQFGKKNLSDAEKREIKRAGISLQDSWKQNCNPRLQYLFRVVDNAAPEKGTQVALETQSLGDSVKKVIADRMDDYPDGATAAQIEEARRKGNPFVTPYAIRFLFDDSKDFAAKYDARPLLSLEMNEEVRAALEADPPSIDHIAGPSNIAQLRLSFEEHWVHPVLPPWDEIFEDAERELAGTPAAQLPGDFPFGANGGSKDEEEDEEAAEAESKADKDEPEEDGEDLFECDECGGLMKADEFTCPKCGTEYDEDGNIVKKAPKKKAAKKTTKKAPAKRGGKR